MFADTGKGIGQEDWPRKGTRRHKNSELECCFSPSSWAGFPGLFLCFLCLFVANVSEIGEPGLRLPVRGAKPAGMSVLKIYTYENCDTCRRAVKWLKAHELGFDEHPIRERPPSIAELHTMLVAYDGELRRLFNTSGGDYREQKLGEKLPGMSETAALALLAGNGNLVKRPFLLGGKVALVGFDDKVWASALLKK